MCDEPSMDELLGRSQDLSVWVWEKLDGLTVSDLPTDARIQLSLACYDVAIEHAQSIIKLVEYERVGSALALQRPMFEAVIRGRWLRCSASNRQIDAVRRDNFPPFEQMADTTLSSLENDDNLTWKDMKIEFWSTVCSYVHTGLEQIRFRLGPNGIQAEYPQETKIWVLHWADVIQIFCGVEFAIATQDTLLAQEFLEQMPIPRER